MLRVWLDLSIICEATHKLIFQLHSRRLYSQKNYFENLKSSNLFIELKIAIICIVIEYGLSDENGSPFLTQKDNKFDQNSKLKK
jgi:hypothetical protein